MRIPAAAPEKSDQPGLVLSERQVRSLASPARHEVFATLLRLGPSSARELADALDQPADALYYHLRHLAKVGLVHEVGKRPTATRPEAVYEVTAKLLRVHPTRRDRRYLGAMRKLFAAALRTVSRRIDAALDDPDLERQGPHRRLTFRTQLVRLDDASLEAVNNKLDELSKLLGERTGDEGELYQVVTVATVVRRSN